ncbi:TPA: hypothetical protein PXP51_003272 [Yersinia enterocolitica]|nr:hypothetical protein [Yersinia enterocolitica]
MNNIEARIERLKSKFEIAKSYGSDQLTVPMPDLSALIAQLEAAQKESDESRRLVLIEASSFGNERFRADKLAKQVECQKDEIVKLTAKLKAAEARLLVPDDWNVLGPTYPAHYTPVLVAMNGVAQHITYQIEEGDNGDYWQPVGNEDADGAPITQFQHWKPLPTGFKVEGE